MDVRKYGWAALSLAIAILLCGCVGGGVDGVPTDTSTDVQTDTPTETETEVETEKLSPEEEKALENQAYLDTVTYLDYRLTGESTPYFLGRWFEKEIDGVTHTVTVSDGSHLYFLVEGATHINVVFTKITRLETPYFAYSIDGAEPVRQLITEPTVTMPDTGKHTVRIVADGMTETENKWEGELGLALREVTPSAGGAIYGIRPEEKVIFFYGDSITEGIRALNMNANANGNSATRAYSWYTAEMLGAVPYVIGYGASGLVRPGSFHPMIDAVDYLSADRRVEDSAIASAVSPDVIVVNHGANDGLGGVSTEDYEVALRAVIARVQEKYPGVAIVYVVPFLEASQSSIRAQARVLDDLAEEIAGLHVVHTRKWQLTYTDGNLHPDAKGAKKAAEKLSEAMKDILGEDFFA